MTMTVIELVDWINQNYPRLSPYLEVDSERVGIYLDKQLRAADLCVAELYYDKYGGGWEYAGVSGIIDKERVNRGARDITQKDITRKSLKAFLNILNLMCDNVIKLIDWYKQFPIEVDREYLDHLGLIVSYSLSNRFEMDDSEEILLTISLPSASKVEYIAFIWNDETNKEVLLTTLTLEELLDKIMKGGQ